MLDPFLAIGEILKPQGVHGEIKLRPITCDPSRFNGLKTVFLQENGAFEPVAVKTTRIDPDAVYLMMAGVRDREAAERLRGRLIFVNRENAVELPEDANFICDLIDCEATDDSGRAIGRLVDVLQPGGGDVYVFRGPLGEVLVPALKRVVLHVDVNNKKILLSRAALSECAVFEREQDG